VRRLIWTLIAMTAVSVFLFAILPASPASVDTSGWHDLAARTVQGAYHVHSTRSDGHGDKRTIAAAAARAGLTFVILTDHGDGTRPADSPEYMDGVLMLDAVEISADAGHYVALDMRPAPYPLGGAGAAVVEDVARLGGLGIAAHPDSPKPALRWTDATSPIDGLEWINADSEWRDETGVTLARAGLAYFLRPAGALASLLDRPATLDRWDALLRNRRVIALGASDAHGGPGSRIEDANRTLFSTIGIPSYEASFRELSLRVILERPLSTDAGLDARLVFEAIRKGSVFTTIDSLATPALLDFHASPSGATVTLVARATLPRGGELVLIGPAGELTRGSGEIRREVPAEAAGAYRVEGRVAGAPGQPPVPWLVSNPIVIGTLAGGASPSETSNRTDRDTLPAEIAPFPWRIEKDPVSQASLRAGAHSAEFDYRLAEGDRASQYAALASDVSGQRFRAVELALTARRPSRIAVQVRTADGHRWGTSFFVDERVHLIHAALAEMREFGDPDGRSPDPAAVTSILLVVDLTNAAPGQSGRFTIESSALVK
jgi:hypothetical protein